MTGNGVMHNGTTILDEYGHNLDRLKASDISFFMSQLTHSVFLYPPIMPLTFSLAVILFITRNFPSFRQAGDTVGVVRKEDGSLHFFVNGVAQGPAAWNVPPSVYAVVDLYGQAAQATIMDDMGERGRRRNSILNFN